MSTQEILTNALQLCRVRWALERAIDTKLRDMCRNAQETYCGFQGLVIENVERFYA